MKHEVDVAIVGAGTAGLNAHRAAQKAGKSALLIDPGPHGTTCARIGCMPSKLLIAPANRAHLARTAGTLGVDAEVSIRGRDLMERLRRHRDRFVGGVLKTINQRRRDDMLLEGKAHFVEGGVLAVGDDTVHANAYVLAVGSRPFIPPPYRDIGGALLTNENVFELEELPESLLVVGTGIIGLELGQAFHRLGVRTTFISLGGDIAALNDPKMIKTAISILSEELDLHTEHELHGVSRNDDGTISVDFADSNGKRRKETFEKVLVAAGRTSNLDTLNLAAMGVELAQGGPPSVDEHTLQIGNSSIFVPGDANGHKPLLHEASDEGRIAGKNAATFPATRAFKRRTPLGIVFTEPNIAIVGETVDRYNCVHHRVGEVSYENQGRARVEDLNRGLVRIYAESHTGLIVGAEMIGPGVEHMAHLLAWAIQKRTTVEQALDMPFYHPTFEEGLRTCLFDLRAAIDTPRRVDLCDEFSPGG